MEVAEVVEGEGLEVVEVVVVVVGLREAVTRQGGEPSFVVCWRLPTRRFNF